MKLPQLGDRLGQEKGTQQGAQKDVGGAEAHKARNDSG